MEEICRLGKESQKEIVAFDCLCFRPTFWQQEDWENLLKGEYCHLLCSAGRRANCRRAVSLQLAGKRDYVKIMSLTQSIQSTASRA